MTSDDIKRSLGGLFCYTIMKYVLSKNEKSALKKYKYAQRYKFEYVEFEKVWPIPSY